ncbi:hypothetical protein HK101_002647 [Irineochytrium annulatum]|nr:hypothetical protein HK101_002647 [Irineochytrium annulatum]
MTSADVQGGGGGGVATPICLVTNDDGQPNKIHSPFLLPFLETFEKTLGWEYRVVIPNKQKSWIGKGFHLDTPIVTSLYSRPTSSEIPYDPFLAHTNPPTHFTLHTATPATCVHLGLPPLTTTTPTPTLVISGPNLGRNATAGSTLSSGTLGAAMEAALLGYRGIALSFAIGDRGDLSDPAKVRTACEVACSVLRRLWERWSPDVEVYNVNVPLGIIPTSFAEKGVLVCGVQQGGYRGLFKRVEVGAEVDGVGTGLEPPGNGGVEFRFAPRFIEAKDIKQGEDLWGLMNGYVTVTPMRAAFQVVGQEDFEGEGRRLFSNL